jgi:outer membrane protein TolC
LALEQQPALAAQRASLAAAADNQRAVDNIHIPTLIARELPIRRHQAALGVQAAAAGLEQAEHDTSYAVTRTYFSVLYARAQLRVARVTVDRLKAVQESAKRQLDAGARDVTQSTVDRITVYLRLAETRQIQAAEGAERALAALREAIGVGPNCDLQVTGDQLPQPGGQVAKHDIIALALAHRGELIQAGSLADVTSMEVDAQGTSCRTRMSTFASAGDIHAREVPPGMSDGEYRPGAIAPEMPGTLVGSRSARMERARSLSARAAAVVDKTRNLITLEAEDAFLKWQEAFQKLGPTHQAAVTADKLAEDLSSAYRGNQNVKVEDVITAQVLGGQAQAQWNETLYQYLLALAALERVTGGGFHAGLTQVGK